MPVLIMVMLGGGVDVPEMEREHILVLMVMQYLLG